MPGLGRIRPIYGGQNGPRRVGGRRRAGARGHGGARGGGGRRPGDGDIAALAVRQHGVVARWQLLAMRFTRRAIDNRIASGRLHPVYRGVYSVGHAHVIGRGRWMAAVLACGPQALLSHRSAAALWDLAPSSSPLIDVTASRARAGHRGIRLHRPRTLHPEDRARRDTIPVTSIARTLFDLAEAVDRRRLERAFEQAERLRLLNTSAVARVCERGRGRRALKVIAPLLAASSPTPETRSELERRFLDVCRRARLPPPEVNVLVEGFEVDALWRDQKLIVELDGYEYHSTRAAFERDRDRDMALQISGYRIIRVTSRRLADDPGEVADGVRALLGWRADSVRRISL